MNKINNYVIVWTHLDGEQVVTTIQGASPRRLSEKIHEITEEGFITQVVMVDRIERVVERAGLNISDDFFSCLGCDDCESGISHV